VVGSSRGSGGRAGQNLSFEVTRNRLKSLNQMPSESKPQSNSISEAILRILAEGSVAAIATLTEASNAQQMVGEKVLVPDTFDPGPIIGTLGNEELDRAVVEQATKFLQSKADTRIFQVREFAPALVEWSEAKILFERIQPEPRVVVCGAGHVGASLAKLASLIGYRATLIDDRAEFVTPGTFPESVELVAAENWTAAVKSAVGDAHAVSMAIVTRGHSEDEQCLRAIIGMDLDYIGLIGSKRRTNIVLDRLRTSGIEEERLGRVRAPVGLDIGAVTPEEVALAIMSEIVAVRRGGKGQSLSEWRREKPGRGRG
jgi:xanthine dehydrogenase accessory factor